MSEIEILKVHPTIQKIASCSPETYTILEKTDISTKWMVDLARKIMGAEA